MKTTAIIVAAGESIRFGGDLPKQFELINGKPMLAHTISRFEIAETINEIILVVSKKMIEFVKSNLIEKYNFQKITGIAAGGMARQESVLNGLKAVSSNSDKVAIHDGARPLVHPSDIDRVVEACNENTSAILAISVTDTIKKAEEKTIVETIDRTKLYQAQTPQVFQYNLILQLHESLNENKQCSDDAMLVESAGGSVKIVEPNYPNYKITTKNDLNMVEALMKGEDV